MALGVHHREYKTRNRYIQKNLATHSKRMQELMAQGMPKEQASKQAYDELFGDKKRASMLDPETLEQEWEDNETTLREFALSDNLDRVLARLGSAVKSAKMTRDGMEIAGVNGRFVYVDIHGRGGAAVVEWEAYENDGARIESGSARYGSNWGMQLDKVVARTFGRTAGVNRFARVAEKVAAAVAIRQQGVVVVETDGRGYMVNYPDGEIEGARSHSDAEGKAKKWLEKNLEETPEAFGVGSIEWRKVDAV